MSGFLINPYIFTKKLSSLTFVGLARGNQSSNLTYVDISISGISWQPGDLCLASGFWDNGSVSTVSSSGFTAIVDNVGGTEYPEGGSFYRILQSGDSNTVRISNNTSDNAGGAVQIFRPDVPITTVTVGNTAVDDGPSALSSTIAAESPTTVPTGEIRLKGYFLCGRITGSSYQNPTPTFPSGWTWSNGGTSGMDMGYKILSPGDTDASNTVTTDDTGRQGHHLFNLTLT